MQIQSNTWFVAAESRAEYSELTEVAHGNQGIELMLFIGLKKSQRTDGFRNADFGSRNSCCQISFFVLFALLSFPTYRTSALAADAKLGGSIDVSPGRGVQGGSIKGKVVADIPGQRKPLTGVVVYLSGERLANQTLANRSLADKRIQAVSDQEGRYDFSGLIAGNYIVSLELQGFKKYNNKSACRSKRLLSRTFSCSLYR